MMKKRIPASRGPIDGSQEEDGGRGLTGGDHTCRSSGGYASAGIWMRKSQPGRDLPDQSSLTTSTFCAKARANDNI